MSRNPNFPLNLDIRPSTSNLHCYQNNFDASVQEEAIRKYGIAGRVWEAAYALISYLDDSSGFIFDPAFPTHADPMTILELGSGTGIVGSAIAGKLGRKEDAVIVTDLPEVCPLLEENLPICSDLAQPTNKPRVLVRPLAWGNCDHATRIAKELAQFSICKSDADSSFSRRLTHIVCSDLVYFPELLAPLLRTLIHLTSAPFVSPSDPQRFPQIIISYKIRSLAKETPFWSAFGLWFSYTPVLSRRKSLGVDPERASDCHNGEEWARFGDSMDDDIFVFVASRRPESLSWEVPQNDRELLAGVNAQGSCNSKSDDTFEALLLLSMGG